MALKHEYIEELTYAPGEALPYVRWIPKPVTINGFTYTHENAYFLENGDIVPKICPYCKCEVERPESYMAYLEEHDTCNND